jgi:hypothetical protein
MDALFKRSLAARGAIDSEGCSGESRFMLLIGVLMAAKFHGSA